MNRNRSTESNQPTGEPQSKTVAVRTYQQIAQILGAREGAAITPQRVAQICRRAELKFARALLADPDVQARLRARAWDAGYDGHAGA